MFAMKFNKRAVGALASAVTLIVQCYSQIAAPASLPPCLIQYSSSTALTESSTSRLILYNLDQTYVQINSFWTGPSNHGTNATHGGTYTYIVDAQNSAHATIVYDGGSTTDELYFITAKSGGQVPPSQVNTVGGPVTAFTLYPKQATNGGCNLSNHCQLASGSTATSGFVVQSGGPRWVLLRAVGTSLGNYGVSATVSSPSFTLYDSTQTVVGTSSVWSADPNLVAGYATIFSLIGAFPLNSGSDEGVLLVPLNPGSYTAQFKASSAGTILCEAYILPF